MPKLESDYCRYTSGGECYIYQKRSSINTKLVQLTDLSRERLVYWDDPGRVEAINQSIARKEEEVKLLEKLIIQKLPCANCLRYK